MKSENILTFAGVAIGGYFLYRAIITPKDSGSGGGSVLTLPGQGVDLSGLFSGIAGMIPQGGGDTGLGLGDIAGLMSMGNIGGGLQGALDDALKAISGKGDEVVGMLGGAGESIAEKLNETGGNIIDQMVAALGGIWPNNGEEPTPSGEPGPNSEEYYKQAHTEQAEDTETSQSIRDRLAKELVGVGGAFSLTKLAPMFESTLWKVAPKVAGKVGVKVGSGIFRFAGPVGVAYTIADILATGYEFISGKSFGGDWLGWGEMLGFAKKDEPKPVVDGFYPSDLEALSQFYTYNPKTYVWNNQTWGISDIFQFPEYPTPVDQPGPNAEKDIPVVTEKQPATEYKPQPYVVNGWDYRVTAAYGEYPGK